MIPVVVWYVAVNAAAFGLCAAARSRRTGGALSALVRLTVVAGGAPGMLLSRAIWRRGPRETGPLALAWPLIWLLLHAAVLAAQILAVSDEALAAKLDAARTEMAEQIAEKEAKLQAELAR